MNRFSEEESLAARLAVHDKVGILIDGENSVTFEFKETLTYLEFLEFVHFCTQLSYQMDEEEGDQQ